MPQIQFVGTPRPSTGGAIGEGFAKGFEKSLDANRQLSLQQKMNALDDQHRLDLAKKQYQQQQELMAPYLAETEKNVPGFTLAARTIGLEKAADILKTVGPQGITATFGRLSMPQSGMQNVQNLGPQRQMMPQENQMVPIQDREKVEEPEFQQMRPTQTVQQPVQAGSKQLNDYIRDELQLRGLNSMQGVPPQMQKQIVDAAAVRSREERESNAASIKEQVRQGERFKKPVADILTHASDAEKLIPNFEVALAQNEKMKTSPATWDAMVTSMADQYPWIANFKSSNAQILEAQTPAFIADFKGKMGGVLTDAKINLISKKVAGVGKDKDANRLILNLGYLDKKLDIAKAEKTNELLRNNNNIIPGNFDVQLKQAMLPLQKEVNEDLSRLLNGKSPKSEFSKTSISGEKKQTVEKLDNQGYSKGDTATDSKTGQKYLFDGQKWTKTN